jgi:hypothetical protein
MEIYDHTYAVSYTNFFLCHLGQSFEDTADFSMFQVCFFACCYWHGRLVHHLTMNKTKER